MGEIPILGLKVKQALIKRVATKIVKSFNECLVHKANENCMNKALQFLHLLKDKRKE